MADKGCDNPKDTSEVGGATPTGDSGVFEAECFYSHTSHDDPIVSPGVPGAAHEHDFIGAQGLNAFSTNNSIRQDANNCIRRGPGRLDLSDKSAYWVPALYVNDQKVVPDSGAPDSSDMSAYYRTGSRWPADIRPFPSDFRAIAGNAAGGPAGVGDQTIRTIRCPGGVAQPAGANGFPLCNTAKMDIQIGFGDCWDGRSDSPNHRDHLAFSQGYPERDCPPSHPIEVPALVLIFKYPTRGGPGARLATTMTGGTGSFSEYHADFMNGWDQSKQKSLIDNCLNVDRYCGVDVPVPGHP